MSGAFASLYARYYDAIYGGKDYAAESAYFEKFLKKHGIRPGSHILSFGAGTLNHEQYFAAKGYVVNGVELSADMVAQGKTKIRALSLDKVSIEQGDMRTYRPSRVYDAVLIPFNVVSYCADLRELDATIAAAARSLRAGGVLAFDCWDGDVMKKDPPRETWSKLPIDGGVLYKLVHPSPVSRSNTFVRSLELVAVRGDMAETYREDHTLSGWTPKQLRSVFAKNGFKMAGLYEWMTTKPAGKRWAMMVIGAKKK
jgi:SAM-dependent methyltransferase